METIPDATKDKTNEANSIGKLASSAVFLSVIGVASQVILLSYQIAFLTHFKIPSHLVEATIAKSVASGAMLITIALFGWNFLGWFTEEYLRPKGKAQPYEGWLLYGGMAVTSVVMYVSDVDVINNLMLTSGLFLLICLLLRIDSGSLESLFEKPKPLLGLILALCLQAFMVPTAIGRHIAQHEREFWGFDEAGKSFAVIERYGEYLIAIPHDPIQNTVGPGFKLIKMEKLTETLVPKKSKTPPKVLE